MSKAQTLTSRDYRQIPRLFRSAPRTSMHLDWRRLDDWLGHDDLLCRVARDGTDITTLLGATLNTTDYPPPDESPTMTAWLRFAISSNRQGRDNTLDDLWDALQTDLIEAGVSQVALLAMEPWIGTAAANWGFEEINAVVTMRRTGPDHIDVPDHPYTLREVDFNDMPAVAAVDAWAFGPLWRYSEATIEVARRQAVTMTILEDGDRALAYQLSTHYNRTGHLARLAVIPNEQGRGLGRVLVGEMLHFFAGRGVSKVTVNTQADNARSQRLYKHYGFDFTGYSVPVWSLDLT